MGKRHQRRARAVRNQVAAPPAPAGPLSATAPPITPASVSGATRVAPPSSAHRVTSAEAAVALAQRLLTGDLRWPVVVLTTASRQPEPYVPVADLLREVGGSAEVVVLPTGAPSWAFSRELPAMTQVFGGASRVYAPDRRWVTNPYASPLRFSHNDRQGAETAYELAADVFALVPRTTPVPTSARQVAGEVRGSAGSRGLVQLDVGGMAAIWAELTVPEVAIEQLVRRGQRVYGLLEESTNRLDIRGMLTTPPTTLPVRTPSHVLARVEAVTAEIVTVSLVPGRSFEIPAHRASELPLAAFVPGETVVATWWQDDDGAAQLRLDLWDGVEQVEQAPAILPGGPPWLEVPRPVEDVTLAGGPEPEHHPEFEVDPEDALGAELLALRRLTIEQRREIDALKAERANTRRQARARVGQRRRRELEGPQDPLGEAFSDPEEQLRFEVHLAWARRIPAGQKAELALRRYALGPRFLASLDELEGVARSKVVDVLVEVLTGLAPQLAGRDLHQLRTGDGGDDPVWVREDGATCWRAALQRETASARRLHYWELVDGTVELSRVVKHDDTRP